MSHELNWFNRAKSMRDALMREPRLELGCPKAPDPKSTTPPEQEPNEGRVVRTDPHQSAPSRAGHVTAGVIVPSLRPLPAFPCEPQPHRFRGPVL